MASPAHGVGASSLVNHDPSTDHPPIRNSNPFVPNSQIPSQTSAVAPQVSDIYSRSMLITHVALSRSRSITWSTITSDNHQKNPTSLTYIEPNRDSSTFFASINEAEIITNSSKWKNAVLLYIVYYFPYKSKFKSFVTNVWKPKGNFDLFPHSNGFILVNFSCDENYVRVLKDGPWTYDGRVIILKIWSSEVSDDHEVLSSIPIWVRLPGLNLNFWSASCLSKIASVVGKPVYMDLPTSSQVKLSFARILVEMSTDSDFPHNVDIQLPSGVMITQRLIYEYVPAVCKTCVCFSHNTKSCPLAQMAVWKPTGKIIESIAKSHIVIEQFTLSHTDGSDNASTSTHNLISENQIRDKYTTTNSIVPLPQVVNTHQHISQELSSSSSVFASRNDNCLRNVEPHISEITNITRTDPNNAFNTDPPLNSEHCEFDKVSFNPQNKNSPINLSTSADHHNVQNILSNTQRNSSPQLSDNIANSVPILNISPHVCNSMPLIINAQVLDTCSGSHSQNPHFNKVLPFDPLNYNISKSYSTLLNSSSRPNTNDNSISNPGPEPNHSAFVLVNPE